MLTIFLPDVHDYIKMLRNSKKVDECKNYQWFKKLFIIFKNKKTNMKNRNERRKEKNENLKS